MIRKITFILAVVFLCLTTCIIGAQANELFTDTVQTWNADSGFNQFIKHGRLINQSVNFLSGPFSIDAYKTPFREWIMLHDNLGGINDFLKQEINTKDLANKFLTEQLARFLISTMCNGDTLIIDKDVVAAGLGTESSFLPGTNILSPTPSSVHKKLEAKLKSYQSDAKPIVVGNKWTLGFNALTGRGGVVHWLATGTLAPFQISSFNISVLEADGIFFPLRGTR
jgi:hypothetical protein